MFKIAASDLLKGVGLLVAYFFTAYAGLQLDAVSGFAALVWPPTGIALAAIFLLGYRFWPAIALGAFAINFITGAPPLIAAGIAAGNTLEAVLGVYALRYVGFDGSLGTLRDARHFIALGVLSNTLVSATIGVTSLWLGGIVASDAYGSTWFAWWTGDVLGALVVGSFLLTLAARAREFASFKKIGPYAFLMSLLLIVDVAIFSGRFELMIGPFDASQLTFFVYPFIIAIALRFGPLGTTGALLMTSVIVIFGTALGYGRFATESLWQSLFVAQLYIAVMGATSILLAAVESERSKMREHLSEIDRVKSEFIALASHQLRTPLAVMKFSLEILQLPEHAKVATAEQQESLAKLTRAHDRTVELVNDLLNVSKIELGIQAFQPEVTTVARAVREAVAAIALQADAKRITIRESYADEAACINIHPGLLRIVMENLLTNSLKYSPVGKAIHVSVRCVDGKVTVAVADQGYGIPKEQQGKIFTKLFRADNAVRIEPQGSGLGLYMAKFIMDASKGSISFESGQGGTTFYLIFPQVQRA